MKKMQNENTYPNTDILNLLVIRGDFFSVLLLVEYTENNKYEYIHQYYHFQIFVTFTFINIK